MVLMYVFPVVGEEGRDHRAGMKTEEDLEVIG